MGIAAHSHTLAPSPPPFIHTSFLPPPAFGCLLATSRTLRTALVSSAAAWRKAAAHFGPAAAAMRAPLTDEELMEAAREATAPLTGGEGAASAAPYHRRAHIPPGGWAPHAPPPGGWTPATAARALYDARQAQPVPGSAAADQAATARLRLRAAAGKAADAAGAYGWAADAAPAECASHRDAVARYNGVVGAYGADGARAVRVWARLERALKARAPVVYDSLLPGWRAPPPPAAVDPAAVPSVAAAVAASAALHFGQVTCDGEADRWVECRGVDARRGGGGREHWLAWELWVESWLSPRGGDNHNSFLEVGRRMAAALSGLAGAAAFSGAAHAGFLHPALLPWGDALAGGPPPFDRPDRSVWFVGLEGCGGGGPPVPALLDPARMRPLLSTGSEAFTAPPDDPLDPEFAGRDLFLDLVTGGVWARAAAAGEMRDLKGVRVVGGLLQLPPIVLVRADGGLGLLGWLEELAGRMEAGLYVATPAVSLVFPRAWEGAGRRLDRGEVLPGAAAREACLSACPGLPLAQDPGAAPSPAALAALARAWSHAGVGVALTGGVLQIVAGLLYTPTVPALGPHGTGAGRRPGGGARRQPPSHGWACRVTIRLLQGDSGGGGGGGGDTDVDATWPPIPPAQAGDGEFFPPLPVGFRGDLLRAVTLVGRRWVMRDPHGRVTDVVDGGFHDMLRGGPGGLGPPRLLPGGREFSYTSRTFLGAARRGAGGRFDASILPGAQLGSIEGAIQFEGELVGGGVITFWARAPVLVLEVPRWRG